MVFLFIKMKAIKLKKEKYGSSNEVYIVLTQKEHFKPEFDVRKFIRVFNCAELLDFR